MRKQLCSLRFAILVGALWCIASAASAQESVAGTVWFGSEDLPGFGKLEFELHRDGKAVMHDVQKDVKDTVYGTWAQSGASVIITFSNCEYKGSVADKRIKGTARYTSGPNRATWNFNVGLLGRIPEKESVSTGFGE